MVESVRVAKVKDVTVRMRDGKELCITSCYDQEYYSNRPYVVFWAEGVMHIVPWDMITRIEVEDVL